MDYILVAIICRNSEFCLEYYLDCIYNQTYDKNKIHLYIKTNDNNDSTTEILKKFINIHSDEYASIYFDDTSEGINEKNNNHEWTTQRFKILGKIRQCSIDYAIKLNVHYFTADCDNFICTNTIQSLFDKKVFGVISPMLVTTPNNFIPGNNDVYSNFHFTTTKNGYYTRHENYYKIINKEIVGTIKVDVVHCTYFINKELLENINYIDSSERHEYVIFSETLRNKKINQYIDNTLYYGFLTLNTDPPIVKKEINYWKMKKKNNSFSVFDTKYGILTLYNNDKYITSSFKNGGYWDEESLLKLSKYVNKNVIEIGAHCGTSTLFYSKIMNNGNKIHAFEPQKNMYSLLLLNLQNNNVNNVITYNKACFCYSGSATMNSIDIDGGGGVVSERYLDSLDCNFGGIGLGKDGEQIELTTVDSLDLPDIGFIHVDAQGAENFIFSGAVETINKYRPNIFYENNEGNYLYNNVVRNYPEYVSESKFNIKDYCMNVLNYKECIHISGIDYLLVSNIT